MKFVPGNIARVWLHLALGLMITMEAAVIFVGLRFVMPACARIVFDADTDHLHGIDTFIPGASRFLGLLHVMVDYAAWWVVALGIAWTCFEWRVRRENKQSLRLWSMATGALALLVIVVIFAAVMVIPTAKAAQRLSARQPEQVVTARIAKLDQLASQLDLALAKNDWAVVQEVSHEAMGTAEDFSGTGAAAAAILTLNDEAEIEKVRNELHLMTAALREAWVASKTKDAKRIQEATRKFHEAYAQVKSEATRMPRRGRPGQQI